MNNEDNNLNNNVSETPTSVETPTPVETPVAVTPVNVVEEPKVQEPVESISSPVISPVPEVKEKAKLFGFSSLIKVLLFIFVFSICFYFFVSYTGFFRDKTGKKDVNRETTTTTNAGSGKALAYKSFDELINYINNENAVNRNYFLDATKDFTELDFDLKNKCNKEGDKVSFTIGKNTISYVCHSEGVDDLSDGEIFAAMVNINDNYTVEAHSFTECASDLYYVNDNYVVELEYSACTIGYGTIKVTNVKTKDSVSAEFIDTFISGSTSTDDVTLTVVNNNNTIYFVTADDQIASTTCRVRYIDLDASVLSIKDANLSSSCSTERLG